MKNRVLLKLAAFFLLLAAPPALAHENHDQLGAGPGPAVEANAADEAR